MAVTPPPPHPEVPQSDVAEFSATSSSQGKRRAKYGVNVVVAVVVAVALVVIVNALVDWQVRQLPVGAKSWLRYDLTATRAYTLAPQTQKLLSGLDEDLSLTAIMRTDDMQGQSVADLLDEYADASNRLDIDVIHPDRDLARLEAFYQQLEARFADETAPLEAAVAVGLDALEQLADQFGEMKAKIDQIVADESLADDELRQEFQLLANKLGEVEVAYTNAQQTLAGALGEPMPPWSNGRADLLNALRKVDGEVLAPFAREFARRAKNRNAPLGARDTLLRLDASIDAAREPLRSAIETLTTPPTPTRYDRLQASLRQGEVVVILSPDRERVVSVAEMFTAPTADTPARFIGEDRLTGTLVAMQIDQPPLIVFVRDTPVSVTHPRGGFSHVTSRLATADFAITEWAVGGSGNDPRSQEQAAAAPPPTPADGQQAVWIVPTLSLERTTQADRELVASVLKKRLAAGDGVLLCFTYDAEALFRPADPLIELAGAWGIAPRMHELLLHEGLGADGRPSNEAAWLIRDWPSDSPLGGALAGREVQLAAPTPIGFEPRPKVITQALIELDQPRMWTATVLSEQEIDASGFTAESEAKNPVVAATAEALADGDGEPRGRLMVFTERHWLSDQQAGRRLGNSELFMNSTYWLAGLDEAIAATPRSQDIRRVAALSDGQQLTYRLILLAGLPGLTLLAGMAVWFVRRRG